MPSYSFDCMLACAITVQAESEYEARVRLVRVLDSAEAHLGQWPDEFDEPLVAEVSLHNEGPDQGLSLFAVDGEHLNGR